MRMMKDKGWDSVIKEANRGHKPEIYELWRNAYPNRSRAFLDVYFQNVFDDGSCIFLSQDQKIISALQMNQHILHFYGRKLACSYIFGVATLPDYRRRGHMQYLMESILDEVKHNHLITLVEAFNPKLYESYGFETIYSAKSYVINTHYFDKVASSGVSQFYAAKDLAELFAVYQTHFACSYKRDEHYYECFIKCNTIENHNICVYRNKEGRITGYAAYAKTEHEVKVNEIIYLDSVALMKLLKHISQGYSDITVTVSQSEKLEKLFPLTIPKKTGLIMARINNYELFNKLYNCHVRTPKDAFAILKRPIFLNEVY